MFISNPLKQQTCILILSWKVSSECFYDILHTTGIRYSPWVRTMLLVLRKQSSVQHYLSGEYDIRLDHNIPLRLPPGGTVDMEGYNPQPGNEMH